MKARLVGFRGSRRDVINNYGILEVEGGNIAGLIGERVSWSSGGGKLISGVILRTHGKRALLARFKKGLPGNALGKEIAIGPIPAPMKKAKAVKKPAKPVKKAEEKPKKPTKVEKKKAPAKKKPAKKTAKKAPTKAAKKPVKKPEKKAPKKKPAAKKAPTKGKTKAKPKKSTKAKKKA